MFDLLFAAAALASAPAQDDLCCIYPVDPVYQGAPDIQGRSTVQGGESYSREVYRSESTGDVRDIGRYGGLAGGPMDHHGGWGSDPQPAPAQPAPYHTAPTYSQGPNYPQGYEIGYREGFESGYYDGYPVGYEVGYPVGYEVGYPIGYQVGYDIVTGRAPPYTGPAWQGPLSASTSTAPSAPVAVASGPAQLPPPEYYSPNYGGPFPAPSADCHCAPVAQPQPPPIHPPGCPCPLHRGQSQGGYQYQSSTATAAQSGVSEYHQTYAYSVPATPVLPAPVRPAAPRDCNCRVRAEEVRLDSGFVVGSTGGVGPAYLPPVYGGGGGGYSQGGYGGGYSVSGGGFSGGGSAANAAAYASASARASASVSSSVRVSGGSYGGSYGGGGGKGGHH